MTNTKKLQERIKAEGYKITFLALKLGISYQALLNKINNISEFKATEIFTLCKMLNIDTENKENIFFATQVE